MRKRLDFCRPFYPYSSFLTIATMTVCTHFPIFADINNNINGNKYAVFRERQKARNEQHLAMDEVPLLGLVRVGVGRHRGLCPTNG